MSRPRVTIVGGGFAGVEAARRLGRRAEVTLVARENFLLFTPMLAEVAALDVEPRHIVSPLRQLCPHADVVVGDVTAIDLNQRSVVVSPGLGRPERHIDGDVLVLAAGSVPATFGIDGVEEHTLPFKTIGDAERIQRRVIAMLETASSDSPPASLGIAIVGAGYSGAELAASLADFLADAVPKYYPDIPTPSVTLIDALDRVAPMLPLRLSTAARRALEARHVNLELGRKVTAVTGEGVELEDGHIVEAGTIIWSAGIRANPLAEELGVATTKGGRIVVDDRLRLAPGVFALGDIAAVPVGDDIAPPTAQHAVRQGKWLGKNLLTVLSGGEPKGYSYRTMGELVSLGHRNAVGTVMGLKLSGFIAWFAWRSYYLFRLPTFLRKARVAIDWALDLVFPPDIAGLPRGEG